MKKKLTKRDWSTIHLAFDIAESDYSHDPEDADDDYKTKQCKEFQRVLKKLHEIMEEVKK